jgi:hypothetical protein
VERNEKEKGAKRGGFRDMDCGELAMIYDLR